jgi:hypothetical protein
MRTFIQTIVAAAILGVAAPALAWDGPALWYGRADDANPGGGGILGTGGRHDHGIKCTDCHVDRVQEPSLALGMTFQPALSGQTYAPGQRYTITARLTGAQLGVGCNATDASMHNRDGFAASFEDTGGAAAGALASDAGQTSTSCALPSPPPPGTTALDGDCQVIFATSSPDVDTWTFTWTAPASGLVRVFWGAVDGNCDMMSMKDAAVTGSMTLASPPMASAASDGRGSPWQLPLFASVGLIAFVATPRRRRPI